MTFAQGVAMALLRALVVALIAVPMARVIARALRTGPSDCTGPDAGSAPIPLLLREGAGEGRAHRGIVATAENTRVAWERNGEAQANSENAAPIRLDARPSPSPSLRGRGVRSGPRRQSSPRLLIALLAAAWLMPTVVVGYAYSDGPLSLVRMPLLNELLYTLLLALKLVPVAVAALVLAPPPALSDSARFLHRLSPSRRSARRRFAEFVATLPHGRLQAPLLAGAAVMLLAFSDFELAALLNGAAGKTTSAGSWTIALHEAQQLQSPLSQLAARAGIAAMCELAIVAGGLWLLARARGNASDIEAIPSCLPRSKVALGRMRVLAWSCTALVAVGIVLLPGWIVLRGAAQAAGDLVAQFRLGDELFASFYYASICTGVVLTYLALAGGRGALVRKRRAWRFAWPILLCLPGALGGIVLAMLLLRLFSLPPMNVLLDTPIPLVLGVSLVLLPPALLLRGLFDATSPVASAHLSKLLTGSPDAHQRGGGRAILWHLRGRSWLWLGAILFAMAYFELVICVTLAPIGMTPAIVELYNQMHYGQRAVLSAGVLAAMLVPAAAFVLGALVALLMYGFFRSGIVPLAPGSAGGGERKI